MKTFEVYRKHDETGVSGTGKVIEGVEYSDGTCVVRWVPEESPAKSIGIFDSFGAFLAIHITPHPGNKTEVHWDNGEITTYPKIETKLRRTRRKRQVDVSEVVTSERPTQVGLQHDAGKSTEISQSENREEIK